MQSTISVIGLGYLGVTQALVLTKLGHRVIGVDLDKEKISRLKSGNLGFFEPGLAELLDKALSEETLLLSDSFSEELIGASIHFVCVGTPSLPESGEVDVSSVINACVALGKFVASDALVVGRSTVPIGTSDVVKEALQKSSGFAISVAWNPEFLSEGSALQDSLHPDRIVIGVDDPKSESVLRQLYAPIVKGGSTLLVMDRRTAELVKVASNSFLATKVSFINGVASIAEKTGASAEMLAEAMGLDPRIGFRFLRNGIGFGGGCLPKDIAGFQKQAQSIGALEFSRLLEAVTLINERRLSDTAEIAKDTLGGLAGKKIAILGAAFKPNTDDVRDSPSLNLAKKLQKLGAEIAIHDPVVKKSQIEEYFQFSNGLPEIILDASLIIVATEWSEYAHLDPFSLKTMVRDANVIDGRAVLNHAEWIASGWNVVRLGEGF